MKRIFDLIFACLALLVFFPFMLIISILVYISDRGPVFFKQKRVGLNGLIFNLYKFRTMCLDADKIGPYYTENEDKRITPIGKFLRKSSLDELPQIINVISGDMSIVGPRPNVPQQKECYNEKDWELRNSVKPGITGLAQASLRSAATEEQRLRLDLSYVHSNSIIGDVKIIFMTVKQVLFKGGN